MKKADLSEVVQKIKNNREEGIKSALFLGAGCSVSGGVLLSSEILENIKIKHSDKLKIGDDYNTAMSRLCPDEQREIISESLSNAHVNNSYLYIASLVKQGIIDRIITTNFDNLIVKAFAYEDVFPSIYDLAVIKDFRPEITSKQAVFYLNGQNDGYILLNSSHDFGNSRSEVQRLLKDTVETRTLIVVGYSGKNDNILSEFPDNYPNGLFWICMKDEVPNEKISKLPLEDQENCKYTNDRNSDEFFGDLSFQIGTKLPQILYEPFSLLKQKLYNIANIQLSEGQEAVVQRIQMGWMDRCIEIFEIGIDPKTVIEKEYEELKFSIEKINILRQAAKRDISVIESIKELRNNPLAGFEEKLIHAGILHDFGLEKCRESSHEDGIVMLEGARKLFQEELQFQETRNYFLVLESLVRSYVEFVDKIESDEKKFELLKSGIEVQGLLLKYHPNDPVYNEGLGYLYLLKAANPYNTDTKASLNYALRYYSRALESSEEKLRLEKEITKIHGWMGNL